MPEEELKMPSGPTETDLLVAKIKAQREAEKNKPQEETKVAKLPNSFPDIGGNTKASGLPSLGGIGQRKGGFDFDPEYLKKAQSELNKLNDIADMDAKPLEKQDTRSMLEIMKEKRAKAEQENEEKKKAIEDGGETVEQRKARLLAQRDLLRKQKQEKREAELREFNDKM